MSHDDATLMTRCFGTDARLGVDTASSLVLMFHLASRHNVEGDAIEPDATV